MINKFLAPVGSAINIEDPSEQLFNLGFSNSKRVSLKSTNDVWVAQKNSLNYFIKCAEKDSGKSRLLKSEFKIFRKLHPNIEIYEFETSQSLIIATIELSSANIVSIDQVNSLVKKYESQYSSMSYLVDPSRNFMLLVDFAIEALNYYRKSLIVDAYWNKVLEKSLQTAATFYQSAIPTIVHGDVSPANIFQIEGQLVLIDWEDSLWAFSGYDQLYWMTFLQNSKELTRINLSKLNIDFEICQSVINVIILLKEYLHRNANERVRTLSLEQRLIMTQI